MSNSSSSSSGIDSLITSHCTVDAVIGRSPVAGAVLNGFGIDTCCGGNASIAEAAAHARVNVSVLIAALDAADRDAARPLMPALTPAPSCRCGCR